MNGCVDDGRPSVWAALEALSPPEHHSTRREDTVPGDSDGTPDVDVEGLTGLMLYAPLHPTDESEVELGHIKSIRVPFKSVSQSRWDFLWSVTVGLLQSTPTTVVKTWVPSPTKISFQVLWWGYRLYLPPPIMASLNSGEAEAVKIATTVTAALTWFLSHVSATMVPPPLQPAFLLLQKLGPYVGYIGTFIAWIWGTVQGADKGNGVVLTATWILPVALIPSTIKAPIPSPPTSAPAPSTSAPAPPTDAPEPSTGTPAPPTSEPEAPTSEPAPVPATS
ncbi:hypothetical protein FB45DRAFT_978083 [Roridomyces roridus]|uniref:Uncharacterized protein n=1 Tax=Roridomyces roridus TaxID=1738132 RepID=A0AAD7BVY4_9AGAR|nr:hypothetical protein FB45DRAFT_978083 [Roridomyces roridus]